MKILITGATGFIGERLAESLLEKGHGIACLVRKTSNIDFLEKISVPLVTGDITDPGEMDNIFSRVRPEVVFHCAARLMDRDEKTL
ncbi:MAG: NAD-dependent epimerase/dehydratase family protein, partial [Candidatus Omnitrophota bacterium]